MSRRARGVLGAGPLLLLLMSACAGRAEDGGVPSDVAAACADFARVDCTTQDSCEGGLATLRYGSVDQCITRTARYCQVRFGSTGASFGSAEIATCTANQQAQTCDQWIGTLTPGCGYTGTALLGATCVFDSECQSGFCSQLQEFNVCGVCAPLPAEGDACTVSCGGDGSLKCEQDTDGASRCVRLGSLGASCDNVASCATGFGCAIPSGETRGKCQPTTGVEGDPCDDNVGPLCDFRQLIYCNGRTNMCQKASIATSSEPCGKLDTGTPTVCAGGVCARASNAGADIGTCLAYVPDGGPCEVGAGQIPCEPPALCASGTCHIIGSAICE